MAYPIEVTKVGDRLEIRNEANNKYTTKLEYKVILLLTDYNIGAFFGRGIYTPDDVLSIVTNDANKKIIQSKIKDLISLKLSEIFESNGSWKYEEEIKVPNYYGEMFSLIKSFYTPRLNFFRGGDTKETVTFMKGGKKVTRVIRENKRGTKAVKYENAIIPLSKLKLV